MQFKMKHIIVIKPIVFFLIILFSFKSFSQTKESDFMKDWKIMEVKKETIYLKFEKNNGKFPKYRCLKFPNKKGIVFNLCKGGSLLFSNKFKSDTLCYKHIKDYKTSTMEDILKKVKDFRVKTYKKRPKSDNDKLYQAYDNNDIFKTYIIEVINEKKFILYPVIWRNQRIEQ